MTIKEAFAAFIDEKKLDEKHNTKEVFFYNYETDQIDWNRVERGYRDDFYLDGNDLLDAFEAGVRFGRKR